MKIPHLKKIVFFLLVTATFIALVNRIATEWHGLGEYSFNLSWKIIPGLMLISAGFALTGHSCYYIAKALGASPRSRLDLIKYNFLAQPVKYLPAGGVFNAGVQGSAFGRLPGIGKGQGYLITFLSWYLSLLTGMTIYLAVGAWKGSLGPMSCGVVSAAVITGTLMLTSPLMSAVCRLLVGLASRWGSLEGTRQTRIRVRFRHTAIAYVHALLMWGLIGCGVFLVADSIIPLNSALLPEIVAAFSFSCVLGLAVLILPSGFGVREGALVFLLGNILSAPLPAMIAVISRLSWIFAELFNFVIGIVLQRCCGSSTGKNDSGCVDSAKRLDGA